MQLTPDQIAFLSHHRVAVADVLDATGMSKAQWQARAKAEGKPVIIGTPCARGAHRLRTRAGHCAQCDSSKLTYQKRPGKPGWIYVAGSLHGKLIKVGSTESITDRERSLRSEGYAGFHDWEMLFHLYLPNAGEVELRALSKLAGKDSAITYVKEGRPQVASEARRCSTADALEAIYQALAGTRIDRDPWLSARHRLYDWRATAL